MPAPQKHRKKIFKKDTSFTTGYRLLEKPDLDDYSEKEDRMHAVDKLVQDARVSFLYLWLKSDAGPQKSEGGNEGEGTKRSSLWIHEIQNFVVLMDYHATPTACSSAQAVISSRYYGTE